MILYGLKNCDTCRKALRSLATEGFEVTFRDIRTEQPDVETLQDWWDRMGEKLLNSRSKTWRDLPEIERNGDPVSLMQQYPVLMKRPIVVTAEGEVSCGWSEKA